MNVLVIGSGGREHAIVKTIKNNPKISKIFAAPGNGGIAKDAECININPCDSKEIVRFCKENNIDFVIVTPDDPLCMGMVDELENNGIPAFGPDKKASEIEGSKIFAKKLMTKYNIKTASYEVFDNADEAKTYLSNLSKFPAVIKADGLALGKGVIIAENLNEAICAINEIMIDKKFGESGSRIIIEECLVGKEVSVLCFCDGKTIVPMPSAMDHKRILNGDKGPNTGGMGTISPNPYYTKELEQICLNDIFLPTMHAMNSEGRPFKGCLFFGLMIVENVPYVIEYNCRFGDPETQVVLPLLQTDLLDVMLACRNQTLADISLDFSNHTAVCVVMASGGYPREYQKGISINGLDENGNLDGAQVFHAGTALDSNGNFKTNGGRVLGITAVAPTQKEAISKAYHHVRNVDFENCYYRVDIGNR